MFFFLKHSFSPSLPTHAGRQQPLPAATVPGGRVGAGPTEPRALPAELRGVAPPECGGVAAAARLRHRSRSRSGSRYRCRPRLGARAPVPPSLPPGGGGWDLLPPAAGRGWSPVACTISPPPPLPPFSSLAQPPPQPSPSLNFPPPHHSPRLYFIIINH